MHPSVMPFNYSYTVDNNNYIYIKQKSHSNRVFNLVVAWLEDDKTVLEISRIIFRSPLIEYHKIKYNEKWNGKCERDE